MSRGPIQRWCTDRKLHCDKLVVHKGIVSFKNSSKKIKKSWKRRKHKKSTVPSLFLLKCFNHVFICTWNGCKSCNHNRFLYSFRHCEPGTRLLGIRNLIKRRLSLVPFHTWTTNCWIPVMCSTYWRKLRWLSNWLNNFLQIGCINGMRRGMYRYCYLHNTIQICDI